MKKLLLALAVGAGLAYLFDPQLGSRRRADLKRKLDRSGQASQAVTEPVDVIIFDERIPAAAGSS